MTSRERLEAEVLALPPRERAALAHRLILSLETGFDEGVEEEWVREAESRYEAYRAGKLEPIPAEDVMREARRSLE